MNMTIRKNTETLIDASKEVGLEIIIEKTKQMLLSRHQNVSQNLKLKFHQEVKKNMSVSCIKLRLLFAPKKKNLNKNTFIP
jgi:hypothetical protein